MATLSECGEAECLKKGLHLRLSYWELPYFISHVVDDETEETKMTGVYPEKLIPALMGGLNITYEYLFSPVSGYDSKVENGTWPGELGMLQRKESDISVGVYYVEEDKFAYFSSLEYLQRSYVILLASTGKQELFDFFNFLYQTEKKIWILLLICLFSVILVSAAADAQKDGRVGLSMFWKILSRSIWMFIASIFCEGSSQTMYSRRGQLLQFMWLFCVLVIVNLLYSQFKGILMVQFDDNFLRTVQDLADRPDMITLITPNTIIESIFKDSPLESYQNIYREAIKRKDQAFIETYQHADLETYQLVKAGTHVLSTGEMFCKIILGSICSTLDGKRKFYFINGDMPYVDYNFYTNWDFPDFLKRLLNNRILRTKEGGLIEYWFSLQHRSFDRCVQDAVDDEPFLKLKHLHTAFYLYLSCLILATIVFIFELIFHIFFKKKTKKNKT